MLIEIQCDQFLNKDPVIFKKGLNIVLGQENARNSIGKTTFLLIIDFAFGGKDYVLMNDQDVNKHINFHVIKFAFEFDKKKYYFSRSTGDINVVNECDENYQTIRQISLDTYNTFLNNKYGMSKISDSFREQVSPYFRIYGRDNYDEKFPLKGFRGDKPANGLKRLMQLFEVYGPVEELSNLVNDADDRKKTHKNALKYQYLSGAENKTEFRNNAVKIKILEKKIEQLEQKSDDGVLEMDSVQSERIQDILSQLRILRRQAQQIQNQMDAIDHDAELQKRSIVSDFSDLKEFFPDVDVKRLETIESFHKKLSNVMTKEGNAERKELTDSLDLINKQVEYMEGHLLEVKKTPNVELSVLQRYAELDRELTKLQAANKYFTEKESLESETSDLHARLKELVKSVTRQLQNDINIEMHKLNTVVCGPSSTAPILSIESDKKYVFTVVDDKGTGSQTRGMFLLDLAILSITKLPALIHDSYSIKQVEDPVMINLMKEYDKSPKQVFIALDKGESYSEDGTLPEIIAKNTCLRLAEGSELFGWAWNKRQSLK